MANVWPDTFEIDMLTLNIIPPGMNEGNAVLSSQLQQGVLYNPLPPIPDTPSVPEDVIQKAKERADKIFTIWISHHPSEPQVAQEMAYKTYLTIVTNYISTQEKYAKEEADDAAAIAAARQKRDEYEQMIQGRVAKLDSGEFTRALMEKRQELNVALNPFIDQIAHLELQILKKKNSILEHTIQNINADELYKSLGILEKQIDEIRGKINMLASNYNNLGGYNYNSYVDEELEKKMSSQGSEYQVEIRKNKELNKQLREKEKRDSKEKASEEERRASEERMEKQEREKALETINKEQIHGEHTINGIKARVDFTMNIYNWYMGEIGGVHIDDMNHFKIQEGIQNEENFFSIRDHLRKTLKAFNTQYTNHENYYLHGKGTGVNPMEFVRLYDGNEGNPGIRYYVEMIHKICGEFIFKQHSIQMQNPRAREKINDPSEIDIYLRSVIDAPLIDAILNDLSEIKYFHTNLPTIQAHMFKIENTYDIKNELFNYLAHLGEVAYIFSFNKSIKYNQIRPIQQSIISNKVTLLLEYSRRIKTALKDIYLRIFQVNIEGRRAELREKQIKKEEYEKKYNEIFPQLKKKQDELRGLIFSSGEKLESEIRILNIELKEISDNINSHNDTIRSIEEIIVYYEYLIRKYSRDTIIGLPSDNFKFDMLKLEEYGGLHR
jgi:hypothetical protein